MQSSLSVSNRKPVLIWMTVMIGFIMLMVVVGGVTRLTESGLSMVNWHPIHGTLPPIGEAEWAEEFAHYQESPEFQKRNFDMGVEEFKGIFWLEYLHRLLGRIVGLAFAIPLIYFLMRRYVTTRQALTYGGIFLLGGAQGLLGWYMVKSGLVNEPRVSPLRLSAHLTMACLLFCLLNWQWWRLRALRMVRGIHYPTAAFLLLTFMQIILGAWVAGLDAGLAYDSFPTMNGKWVPSGLWVMDPWWHNPWQNPTTAQFLHRLGAVILTFALIALLFNLWRKPLNAAARMACYTLVAVLILQITLGALTIIHHVPLILAALHQFTALLLLGGCVTLLYNHAPDNAKAADDD